MGRQNACQKQGAHACRDVSSHRATCGWMAPVGYVAHVSDCPSPSALPPRRAAVMAHLARFRGMRIGDLHRGANRMHERAWRRFAKRRDAALASLPAVERAGAEGDLLHIRALEGQGLADRANEIYRDLYRRLGLGPDARGLEEIVEAHNASLGERLAGGQLGGRRARIYRFADLGEPASVAESGVLAHNMGQGHLSFTFQGKLKKFEGRPVVISLGLTPGVSGRLTAVSYRSLAFSAPGSWPAFMETWAGEKSWRAGAESEVRLRTPVPVRGLDLRIHLKRPADDEMVRALRRMCGRHGVAVPASWPPYL